MVSKRFPHVGLRDGTYYYIRRVPQKVKTLPEAWEREFGSRPSVRDSLGTKVYSEALKAAALREEEFDASVQRALGKRSSPLAGVRKTQITAEALGSISSGISRKIALKWRRLILRANIDPSAQDFLDHHLHQFIDQRDLDDMATAVLSGVTPVEYAQKLNADKGFAVSEDSEEFEELVAAVIDGCSEARRAVNDMFDGHSLPVEPKSSLIRNFAKASSSTYESKTFSEVAAIQSSTKNFAAKTRAKMKRSQALFVQVIGDKDVNQYTKADIRLFLDHLAEQQVGNASNQGRPISQTTIQSYLSGISSPFNFASSRGWLAEGNPTCGMRIEDWRSAPNATEVPKRRRFEVEELNAIFRQPWFAGCKSESTSYQPGEVFLNDMRYWAPVVALFTGARAAELGGLMLDEIDLDSEAPHILLRCNKYRNTKFKLNRHVPILDALLALGFAEYVTTVRKSGSDRLFPDWNIPQQDDSDNTYFNWANTKWIRAFNRTIIPAALPHLIKPAVRSPVVFHSFRGAFKFMLLGHGNPHLANAILGHSQDELDKAYIGTVSPKETYTAFRSADFEGLKLPVRRLM